MQPIYEVDSTITEITPVADYLIIKRNQEDAFTSSGLRVIRRKDNLEQGIVIAAGGECTVPVGAYVIYANHICRRIKDGEQWYDIPREEFILIWSEDDMSGYQPPAGDMLNGGTVTDINKCRAINKNVIIDPEPANNEIQLSEDTSILIDERCEPGRHAPVRGKVLSSDIEGISAGDIVYYHYNTQLTSVERGHMINNHYLCLQRREIFLVFPADGSDPWPTADYVITEALEDETPEEKGGLYIGHTKKDHSVLKSRVVWANKDTPCKPGDIVVMSPDSDIPIEYDLHRKLNRKLFRMRNKDIIGIWNGELPK